MISVIINCYNGENFLRETINSILESSYTDFELIFYDNASNDSSLGIVKSFHDDRIRIFTRHDNISLGAARSAALLKSSRDLITYIDSDDIIGPYTLEYYAKEYVRSPFALLYGGIRRIDEHSRVIGQYIPRPRDICNVDEILKNFDVNVPSLCIDKSWLMKNEVNFDPNIQCCEEFDLVCNVLQKSGRIVSTSKILSSYRYHGSSLTDKNLDIAALERRYILNKFDQGVVRNSRSYNNAFFKSYYYEARHMMNKDSWVEAIHNMRKVRHVNIIYFSLWLIVKYMPRLWVFVHKVKKKTFIRL